MEETAAPDVSIIVPAWRAEETLAGCAQAALAQDRVKTELIIVDDASPDATWEAATALAAPDARIRPFRQVDNGGPSVARNRALDEARGRWVAVLDADDGMVPDRLRKMIDLAETKQADIVLGNMKEVDEAGQPLGTDPFIADPKTPTEWSLATFVAGNTAAAGGKSFGYLKPLLRRSFLDDNAIRYDPNLRNGEDFHLILACYAAGARVWFSPDPDYLYTRRSGSISHRADPAHMQALMAADRAFAARVDGTPELMRLLRKRYRGLADVCTAEVVLGEVKRARVGAALSALARRPQATARVVRQLAEAVRKRLYPAP